jgi:hypothetical protein
VAARYFSPAEVQTLIPALTALMDRLMPAYRDANALRDRIRGEEQRITLSGGGVIDQQAWQADSQRLERLAREIQGALDQIFKMGGVPKDLDTGLVDFPHLRAGEEVNLCWKYGEREIRYWHGLHEGFASRKPL